MGQSLSASISDPIGISHGTKSKNYNLLIAFKKYHRPVQAYTSQIIFTIRRNTITQYTTIYVQKLDITNTLTALQMDLRSVNTSTTDVLPARQYCQKIRRCSIVIVISVCVSRNAAIINTNYERTFYNLQGTPPQTAKLFL